MKKLRVIAMADRREDLLKGLLRLGCMQISEPDEKLSDPAWSALMQRETSGLSTTKAEIGDVNTALAAIKRYGQVKDGLFIKRHPISEQEFLGSGTVDKARQVSARVGEQLQTLTRLQGEENRLLSRQAGLEPWRQLDMPLESQGHRPYGVPADGVSRIYGYDRRADGPCRTAPPRCWRSVWTSSSATVC